MKLYRAILFLLVIALLYSSFGFYKNYKHNEFHRGRMVQYQYLNNIRDLAENNVYNLTREFPETQAFGTYYVLSPKSEKVLKFFKERNIKPVDFFGYYFEANSKGIIVHADLHKP